MIEESRSFRTGLLIGLCLLAAAGVSIARAFLAQTLALTALDGDYGARFAVGLVLGVPLALAALLYLQAHREGETARLSREHLAAAIAIQLFAALALPLTSSDIFCNTAYGELLRSGLNPHAVAPITLGADNAFVTHQSGWRTTPSPYGPLMTPLSFVSGLAGDLFGAFLIFKLEILLLSLAVIAAAYAFCRRYVAADRAAASFILLAFSPLFAWELSGQAHNDALLVLFLLGFVWAVSADRPWTAFAFVTAACVAKYVAAPVLLAYLAFIWRRAPRRAVLMGAIAAAACAFAVHPYVDGPLIPESIRQPASTEHHARSFTELLRWLSAPLGATAERVVQAIGLTGAIAAMIALTIRAMARATTARALLQESLILMIGVCLLAPWGQPWYATWLLPFALAARDRRWQGLVVLYGALSIAQYGLQIDPLSYLIVSGVPALIMCRLLADGYRASREGVPASAG